MRVLQALILPLAILMLASACAPSTPRPAGRIDFDYHAGHTQEGLAPRGANAAAAVTTNARAATTP
jgi:hypothetical protein